MIYRVALKRYSQYYTQWLPTARASRVSPIVKNVLERAINLPTTEVCIKTAIQ